MNGHLSIIRMLVKAGARADLKDEIGGIPISYALCTKRQDIVNELMKGAQTPSTDEIRDELLLSAVMNNHETIGIRLLDSGADIEAVGKDNMTPLGIAISRRHVAFA